MKNIKNVLFILLFAGMLFSAHAENEEPLAVPGLIFNTKNLLTDIEEYKQGIGFKVKNIKLFDLYFGARAGLNLDLLENWNNFNLKFNTALEFHFMGNQRISPYGGIYFDFGYNRILTEPSTTSFSETINIDFSFGGLVGIEFFLLDFLSIFAEYQAGWDIDMLRQVSDNDTTDNTEPYDPFPMIPDMQFKTGMGNGGCIGIVIYFSKILELKD